MKTYIELLSYGLLSFLLTVLIIPLLKKWAIKIQLVDHPNYRKVHQNPVPLVGGIAVFCASLIMLLLALTQNVVFTPYTTLFATSFFLLIIGIIDDKIEVSAKYKLVLQLLLALILCLDGTRITSLYGLFGIYTLNSWTQYLITMVVIAGVVNAFNLMDGIDGLVGSLNLVGFGMFFIISLYLTAYELSLIAIIFLGTTLGFLRHNLSRSKIFMGDAGSLALGFLLVTLGIHTLQVEAYHQKIAPVYLFLLLFTFFAIPVFDSLRVYMGRIKKGNSPFKADKSHLHHLLLGSGLNHKKTALSIIVYCLVFFAIGIGLAPTCSTTVISLLTLLLFWLGIRFLLLITHFQHWKSVLKKMECKE